MATADQKAPPLRRKCGAMQVHNRLLEEHPGFRERLSALEQATRLRLTQPMFRSAVQTITIPIVVHVVYGKANDSERISKEQIDSQIQSLNNDYAATNEDKSKTPTCWAGLVTDTNIQFSLANVDPAGTPTTGITYTATECESFGTDDAVKSSKTGGADPWPSERYLNLWVCALGNGLLGYAQFPAGPPRPMES